MQKGDILNNFIFYYNVELEYWIRIAGVLVVLLVGFLHKGSIPAGNSFNVDVQNPLITVGSVLKSFIYIW